MRGHVVRGHVTGDNRVPVQHTAGRMSFDPSNSVVVQIQVSRLLPYTDVT